MIQDSVSAALPQKSFQDLKEGVPLTESLADTIGDIPPVYEASIADEKGSGGASEKSGAGNLPEGTSSAVEQAPVHGKSFPFVPLTRITRMPVLKKRVDPIYPEEARRLGKEGSVLLEVGISDAGKVIHVEVIQPMGYGFDEAAKAAIAQSEFEPAQREEVPVAVIVRMPIRFRFKD